MIYNILAVGDVVGACGVKHLSRCLRSLKKRKSIHFTVVNGENAAMVGLTPNDADDIFAAGADVITLGNHTFGKMQIRELPRRLPLISCAPRTSAAACRDAAMRLYDCGAARIAVMNLIGRCDLSFHGLESVHHGGRASESGGEADLHARRFPRRGHQRKARAGATISTGA